MEAFIVIGPSILIDIMQTTYFVKTQDVDLILDNAQAQRIGEAGGHALPFQGLQGGVQTTDPPHVSMGGAEGRITIGKKVVPTGV